jgi:hypothetical protein
MLMKFEHVPQTKAPDQAPNAAAQPPHHVFNNLGRAIYTFEKSVVERERWGARNYENLEAKVRDAQLQIIQEAIGLIASGTLKPINVLWRSMDADERAAFCAQFEDEIWPALERATDFQR